MNQNFITFRDILSKTPPPVTGLERWKDRRQDESSHIPCHSHVIKNKQRNILFIALHETNTVFLPWTKTLRKTHTLQARELDDMEWYPMCSDVFQISCFDFLYKHCQLNFEKISWPSDIIWHAGADSKRMLSKIENVCKNHQESIR